MDAKKELAAQQLKNALWLKLGLHFFSLPIGYAVSYFFQPDILRAKCSLGQYFAHIKDVVTTQQTASTAIIVTLVVAFALEMLGTWLASRAKIAASAVLTKEEIAHCCGIDICNTNLVFGKIKEGEDNPSGALKRIGRMLFIGLGVIFLFIILLIFVFAAFLGNSAQ